MYLLTNVGKGWLRLWIVLSGAWLAYAISIAPPPWRYSDDPRWMVWLEFLALLFGPPLAALAAYFALQWIREGFREQSGHADRLQEQAFQIRASVRSEERIEPNAHSGNERSEPSAVPPVSNFSVLFARFGVIFLGAWGLSIAEVLSSRGRAAEGLILLSVEALPIAVVAASFAALFMRRRGRDFPIPQWCGSAVVIGILSYGRQYGFLRDNLKTPETALIEAWLSFGGTLVLVGVTGLIIFYVRRRGERLDQQS